jgi:hypothetical protein
LKGDIEMKVQFCTSNYFDGHAEVFLELDVCECPTGEQINAVYEDIRSIVGDHCDDVKLFGDYSGICEYVARKHLKVIGTHVSLIFHV